MTDDEKRNKISEDTISRLRNAVFQLDIGGHESLIMVTVMSKVDVGDGEIVFLREHMPLDEYLNRKGYN